MKTTINVANMLIRISGAIQVILGLIIWFGVADVFISVHILAGIVLVLSLWVLAIVSSQVGVDKRFTMLAIAWGLIVLILGLTQTQILPGQAHWVVQVVHLLVGLGAIGLGEGLAGGAVHHQRQTD